ncbi:MAG: hypothetical protein VKJ05_06120 [Synechococcaceae cyanobacterium]|nr:hypothetical protein [Synechococcaceae cyanobacterium]
MARPPVSLHLPRPEGSAATGPILRRARGRRRRRAGRLRQAGMGLLLGAVGVGILAALVRIPDRLDALLLVSHALANVIGGLSRLGLGLLQLGAVLAVVLLALLALLALAGSAVRLWRALVPGRAAAAPAALPERPPVRAGWSGEVPGRAPPPLL